MPVKVERALEREADKRGLEGEERDRFVYGIMRKQGWKPKREVDKSKKIKLSTTMTNRIIRLRQINSKLDPLIEFARYYDEDEEMKKPNYAGYGAAGVAAAGAGYGGYKLNQAVRGRMAGTPGMSYAGGVKDVAASGMAQAADVARQAPAVAADALATAKTRAAGMYGEAKTAINPALARTARAGRQIVAGATAGKTSLLRSGSKILTHTRPTVKKVLKGIMGAATHAYSVQERLIQLGVK